MDIRRIVHPKDDLLKIVRWQDVQHHYDSYRRFGKQLAPHRFLEIGVAAGYSSYAILKGCQDAGRLPELITWVDYCDGRGWDGNHDYALGLVRGAFEVEIDDRNFNSRTIHSFPVTYDLIHVDGDHSYDGCLYDLQLSASYLDPGGHIICHDTNDPNVNSAIEMFLATHVFFKSIDFPMIRCGVRVLHQPGDHTCDIAQ